MENEKKEEKNNKAALIVLSVLLLGSIITNVFLWSHGREVETVMQTKVDTLVINNTNLEVDVKSKVAELEVFKGKNDSLNKVVDEGVSKINAMEGEIAILKKQSKGNTSKRKELEAKVAELNKLTEEYLERIDQLVTQNKLLKKENDSLTTNLSKANSDKTDLEGKVNTASVLKTEYVKVSPMKKKFMSDKMEETSMAKKVIKFKSCFSVMDNKIAPSGKKTLYMRVIAPDGKVIGSPTANSGKFKTSKGDDAQYTVSKEIDYNGTKSDQCLEYDEPTKGVFIPGNYIVELYVDGTLTSTTGLTLK
jgi:peptidoglycan hydrolase CwlO-like protein